LEEEERKRSRNVTATAARIAASKAVSEADHDTA